MTNGVTIFGDSVLLQDGWARNVAIAVNARGDIVSIETGATFEAELMARLPGPAIPGMPNLHSHAHQRAMAGMSDAAISLGDRAEAISHAVRSASADDIVLIAGKGHETYQEIKGKRYHFNDLEVAQKIFLKTN